MQTLHLASGQVIHMRPIRTDDAWHLNEGFRALSKESIYNRFLFAKKNLTANELAYLTHCDQRNHCAFVLADVTSGAERRGLGVGRWIRDPEQPDTAEIGVVVLDEFQGHGLGTALISRLAQAAQEAGIRYLRAASLAENRAGEAVLSKAGMIRESRVSEGVREWLIDLGDSAIFEQS